tara:strand:- start:144 stop:866 length:723 start_codon:yes stop_codon:yes gene_type:complete
MMSASIRTAADTAADTACSARLLVLDTLLPGQRIRCGGAPASFAALVEGSNEPLVCVGRNQLSLHWVGCEAVASRDESGSVVLTASDRLAQLEEGYGGDGGDKWNGRAGRVTWLGRLSEQDNLLSEDDSYSLAKALEHGSNGGMEMSPERLARLGKDVKELTDEFVSLAGPRATELLEQLGQPPEAPNAQAIHVAALLNPIVPINDGFLFIRPAVMTARSTANRLDHAERGLRDAIKRLS